MTNQTHKHSWDIPDGRNDNEIIVCSHCGIDYDDWVEKMEKKGYTTYQSRERFEA